MMQGIIIKGVGGNYYVDTEKGIIECRARGLFRNNKVKPVVGDKVEIRIIDNNYEQGYIEGILPRNNSLTRPLVANVDQIIIVFAVKNPEPSYLLLDKLLIVAELNKLNPIICFNKVDLADKKLIDEIKNIYCNSGYRLIFTSKDCSSSLEELKSILMDKITLFSGPSGVGKSSLMNGVDKGFNLKTGEISEKLKRGKHTTRHAEMYKLSFGGFVVDTPGFSSFKLQDIVHNELTQFYPEMKLAKNECKFSNCIHKNEPGCSVKNLVNENKISEIRYSNYIRLYDEIKELKQY